MHIILSGPKPIIATAYLTHQVNRIDARKSVFISCLPKYERIV